MAASHSPPPGPPMPSSSAGRRSTAPAQPKLRDSCYACASSKLKCYKEKPTCSRCAKRGITCEYVATKRVGRKPNNRSNVSDSCENDTSQKITNANHTAQLPSPSSWFAPYSTLSGTDPLPSPEAIHPSPRPTRSGSSSDPFPNIFSPVDQSLFAATTDPNTDLDDFFASPMSFSMPDLSDADVDLLGQTDFISTGINGSCSGAENMFDPFPGFEDAVSELFALPSPRCLPKNCPSPPREGHIHNYQETRETDVPCSCLARALGLMKQLFPQPSNACTTSSATPVLDEATATTTPTIQTVIARNETTIEAVSAMLKCSCSQDGYLLAIMSLIVFKVLGWYAAAATAAHKPPHPGDAKSFQEPKARNSHHPSHPEQALQDPIVISSFCLDGADSARMASQLVLSELHRVRRLVNQLSSKLKVVQGATNGGRADTPNSSECCGHADGEMTLPFSALMLDQLDVDLRKRLKGLSSEILEGLRRL